MELVKIESGEVKMDSRMIAEHFGKFHKHVLSDIRDEISKLEEAGLGGEPIFCPSSYLSLQNKQLPCYILTEEGALQLAARYDAVSRRKLIIKIKELKEQMTKPSYMIEDEVARAEAWIREQQEKKQLRLVTEKQTQVIGELKPKADYTDRILKNKGLVTITQIAKDYGMSGRAMNQVLHDLKVQYKASGQWLLYKDHHSKGYTHSETVDIIRSNGRPDITMTTKWTQKGRLFLYNLLREEGILPVIEQEAC